MTATLTSQAGQTTINAGKNVIVNYSDATHHNALCNNSHGRIAKSATERQTPSPRKSP